MDRQELKEIIFPSFLDIIASNNELLFIGYSFIKKITENLFVYVDVVNEDLIFPQSKKIIYVGWSDCEKHPIANSSFEYSEEGYLDALQFLDDTARRFAEAFKFFNETARVSEKKED